MTFKLFRNDKLIAEFQDTMMEQLMENWETQYVSGAISLETETMTIWIENKRKHIKKKEKEE